MAWDRYYLLDLVLDVSAPSEILRKFDRTYGQFRNPGACGRPASALASASFQCKASGPEAWTCSGAGGTWTVPGKEPFETLLGLIQTTVLSSSSSFFLVHGASLDAGGTGCLLAAPSAVGKTTLAVGLQQRGWTLLSDEVGAVCRESGRLHSFPRAIHLRRSSLALLGVTEEFAPVEPLGGELRWVLNAATPGRTASPRLMVFLSPPEQTFPLPDLDYIELTVDRVPDGLTERLSDIEGVRTVELLSEPQRLRLRLGIAHRAPVSAAVDRAMMDAAVAVRGHFRGAYAPLDYRSPPVLRPITPGEGIRRLMANLLHGHSLARRRSPAGMGFELSALLNSVRFYTLVPGPLDETLDCIATLCAAA